MAKRTEVARKYGHLDGIAISRRGEHVRLLKGELDAAERSFANTAVGFAGQPMPPWQRQQVVDAIAQKREQLRAVEGLSGDELCRAYCGNEIAALG